MTITERDENGVRIYTIEGRIDSDGAVKIEATLLAAAQQGQHKMILDCSNLRYVNSAGLRILAEILTANRENGGDLHLVALNPKVRRVFEIIGFDNFFKTYADVESALNAF